MEAVRMIGAAKKYQALLTELLIERELAGGTLAEDVESRHVEQLDHYWWAMTEAEQANAERMLADDQPIEAPADLRAEDVLVEQGATAPPRRAA